MSRYGRIRDALISGTLQFEHLDAAQLVKHAFGLRSAVHRDADGQPKNAVLYYLFAEPKSWPDGRLVSDALFVTHRREVTQFAELVEGDEVQFEARSYQDLFAQWDLVASQDVRDHGAAVRRKFVL